MTACSEVGGSRHSVSKDAPGFLQRQVVDSSNSPYCSYHHTLKVFSKAYKLESNARYPSNKLGPTAS